MGRAAASILAAELTSNFVHGAESPRLRWRPMNMRQRPRRLLGLASYLTDVSRERGRFAANLSARNDTSLRHSILLRIFLICLKDAT